MPRVPTTGVATYVSVLVAGRAKTAKLTLTIVPDDLATMAALVMTVWATSTASVHPPRLVHECSIQYSNYLPVRISSIVSCSEYSYCDVSELMCQMR